MSGAKAGPSSRTLGLAASLLVLAPAAALAQAQGVPQTIQATIDVTKTGAPIDPLMWGHFIENLGAWWEGGAWAELIGDRKFYYPIDNDSIQVPSNSRRWVNQWTPAGPQSSVVMDSTRAYATRHAPRIALAGTSPRGIRQAGIPVHAGQSYTGRIVLAGDQAASVDVSLVWGPGPQDRQTVSIEDLSQNYRTYPLSFTSRSDTPTAELSITATGSGSFLVGAVSLMQSDNVEGWRPEYLAFFREMRVTTMRWAGNFSANYEWRDGIGDPDLRPPFYDFAWNGLEPNDVGTFEVLALNRLVGSEPYIGVNAGLGDAYSAGQWVEYVNGSTDTPMGRLRAQHGHPAPFGVKWWGIGNEMYGEWQIGHMAINHFVIQHNKFAERMRAADPSIKLVASGASLYQMYADSRSRPRVASPPYAYDGPFDWSGNLLRHAWQNMDYISEHIYGPYGMSAQYYDSATKQWVRDTLAPVQDRLRRIPNRARGAYEEWIGYLERMPWLEDSGIKLVMDEWSTGGGDMSAGLTVALLLNEMFRHSDVYVRSDHTCAPYANVAPAEADLKLRGTVGIDLPRTSSGSPTYPLDVMAALSSDRQQLTITVVNPSERPQQLQLEVGGTSLPRNARVWTVSGPDIQARNLAGQPPQVRLVESTLSNSTGPVTVAPFSINLYQFQIR